MAGNDWALDLIRGGRVTVIRPQYTRNELNDITGTGTEREQVDGVLFAPVSTADITVERPDGATQRARLAFPKGYGKSLKGCSIEVAGVVWRVVGDPVAIGPANVPGPWDMEVDIERGEG